MLKNILRDSRFQFLFIILFVREVLFSVSHERVNFAACGAFLLRSGRDTKLTIYQEKLYHITASLREGFAYQESV